MMDQQEAEVRRLIESSNVVSGGATSGHQSSSFAAGAAPTSYQYRSEYKDSYGADGGALAGAMSGGGMAEAVYGSSAEYSSAGFDTGAYGQSSGSFVGGAMEHGVDAGFSAAESSMQYSEQSGIIGGQEASIGAIALGGGADFGAASYGASGDYSSASYGGTGVNYGGGIGPVIGGFEGAGGFVDGGAGGFDSSIQQTHSSSSYSHYKIQQDPNPTIIRRQINIHPQAYRQNIHVRFLRPPQLPPPGPLIVKEIRPPQPPPAPPLIIRQRPPRPPTPPPLILRERPPRPPAILSQKVITKRLAALPPPPRQVIIERYPPLPPKPRDIIIERWLPYGPMPKRRVIYQRAAAARAYRTAKNMIIVYESPRPRIERIFRRLGVIAMDPRMYVERYGISLLEAQILVSQARSHGVIEDITPPAIGYGGYNAGGIGAITSVDAGGFGEASYSASSAGMEFGGGSSGAMVSYGESSEMIGGGGGMSGASYGYEGVGMETLGADSQFASSYQQMGGVSSGMSGFESESYRVESGAAGIESNGLIQSASYSSGSGSTNPL